MLLVIMEPLAKRLGAFFRRNDVSSPTAADTHQYSQQPPENTAKVAKNNDIPNLSELRGPKRPIESERDPLTASYDRVRHHVSKEKGDRILQQLPLTLAISMELREFDARVHTDLDSRGRPIRSQSHKQVGTTLFRALHKETPDAVFTVRGGAGEEQIRAEDVIAWLTLQAMKNLESHNIRLPLQRLTARIPNGENSSEVSNIEGAASDHEHAYSMFVLAATLQASVYRPWVLDTLLESLQNLAASEGKGQIHIGPKADLYLLGVAVDVKYKNPALSDKVHEILGTFLPKEHVSLFVREYHKHFPDKAV